LRKQKEAMRASFPAKESKTNFEAKAGAVPEYNF